MKVFVTGATGCLGEEVCLALRRSGHDVYGLVRERPPAPGSIQEAAMLSLVANEINVIPGDLANPDTFRRVAASCRVVIHTAVEVKGTEASDSLVVDGLLSCCSTESESPAESKLSQRYKQQQEKKIFIYTSNMLVYPDRPDKASDETEQLEPKGVHSKRPFIEQKVLASSLVYGVVVRPGFAYGRKSLQYLNFFQQAMEQNKVTVVGKPHLIYSQLHIDDLVDGYLRIAESKGELMSGHIFNFSDESRYTTLQIATEFAKEVEKDKQRMAIRSPRTSPSTSPASSPRGEARKLHTSTALSVSLSPSQRSELSINSIRIPVIVDESASLKVERDKTVILNSEKARKMLNWAPRHKLMLEDVGVYYRAWKAKYLATLDP